MFHLFIVRYLLEDQLSGPSSVEGYIRALRKGCRCVECKYRVGGGVEGRATSEPYGRGVAV